MSRYGKWTEKRISRFENEGRGKGLGAAYRPWIEVNDLSSQGDSRRVFSPLTNRTHHLLSNIEFNFFVLAEFTPDILDIREQYPLDRVQTRSIAIELGIRHPQYLGTQVDTVMTCDFLITRERDGMKTLEAYNCKPSYEANQNRSIEKLEIQRRYFEGCDIPHFLVFDEMLPVTKIRNIKWIRDGCLSEREIEPQPDYYFDHCRRLLSDITHVNRQDSLTNYCTRYDERAGALPGTALRVVRMLLQQRLLVTDLNQPDLHNSPITMFKRPQTYLRSVGGS